MTVQPLGAVLQRELMGKLEADVALTFDNLYARDLVGRASAFQHLVTGGVPVEDTLAKSGLMAGGG